MGDNPHDSIGYQTIFAVGLSLFIMTMVFNLLGHYLRRRFRQEY
jgi:phosphate transport system permease protein